MRKSDTETYAPKTAMPKEKKCIMWRRIITLFLLSFLILIFAGCSDTEDGKTPAATPEPVKEYSVTVHVDYQKGLIRAGNNVTVYIDSEKLGSQSPNTERTFDCSLSPGEHKFYVKEGLYKTSDVFFDVPEKDCSFSFIVKNEVVDGLVARAK